MSRPERAWLSELPGFTIGHGGPKFLEVRVIRRSHPGANDTDDADWVEARVLASAGGFRADYDADLLSGDFPRYRRDLLRLSGDLAREARFETVENGIDIKIVHMDDAGHMMATCEITDQPGMGARLLFGIELILSDLDAIVRDLDSLISAYPAPERGSDATV